MFIDAQYQPHSSSVRVTALAAMSPTTPTHLALPPHSTRENSRAAVPFRLLMEDVERSPRAFAQSEERAVVCLFIYSIFFFFLTIYASDTVQHHCHLSRAIALSLPPFVMWKQPFSCGDFLSFHPDAWHSWQIGCGSEGDGLWKQCPCPHYTHCGHIHEGSQTHKHTDIVCVCTQSHTQYSEPLSPALRQRKRLCCKQGDDLDVKHTKKRKQEMEILTRFSSNFDSNMCFSIASSIQTAALFNNLVFEACTYAHHSVFLHLWKDPEFFFFHIWGLLRLMWNR